MNGVWGEKCSAHAHGRLPVVATEGAENGGKKKEKKEDLPSRQHVSGFMIVPYKRLVREKGTRAKEVLYSHEFTQQGTDLPSSEAPASRSS